MLDLKEKQKANLSLQRGYFRHQKKKKKQDTLADVALSQNLEVFSKFSLKFPQF